MAKNREIGRRQFLVKGSFVFAGTLLGMMPFSKALASTFSLSHPPGRSQLALIIDDIGFSRESADRFLDLEAALTFSILPRLSHSGELAERISLAGHEIMLHQPMEPLSRQFDPGPGALYMAHAPGEITKTVEENIIATPHITGVNNHMGSRFTACCDKIDAALRVVRERALYFVDSRTSGQSIAFETARRLGLPAAQRHVFLDNRRTVDAVTAQLVRLERRAVIHGTAVAIGHPFPETARALKIWSRQLPASGIELVHVSTLLNQ